MVSGNFLIGRDLPLKGFDKYIQPLLEEKGYSVENKLSAMAGKNGTIITSIVGEGDLEKTIEETLFEVKKLIEKENEGKYRTEHIAFPHQIMYLDGEGHQTIGIYKDNKTASQLFPSIAQKYLLEELETQASEVSDTIKSLLGKKLSEL